MGDHISHGYVLKAARILLLLATVIVAGMQFGIIDINNPEMTEWIVRKRSCVYISYITVQSILVISDLIDAVIKMFR